MSTALLGRDGERSVLLHIGPRKTGTTAIQQALATRRNQLRSEGVIYPGTVPQHFRALNRFIGRRQLWEEDHQTRVSEGPWRELIDEIGSAPRAAISTEVMSQVRQADAQRIADSFPGRRPEVVITYRRFDELLASTWQQLVKEGLRQPLAEWSRHAVADRPEISSAPFPRVLDVSTLVEIWEPVVGIENIAVVLVDRRRPDSIYGAFEDLLALPEGSLASPSIGSSKRSLTAQEAELLRRTNTLLARDPGSLRQQRSLRRVVAQWVDEHPAGTGDNTLDLPLDVMEQATDRAGRMVESLQAMAGQIRMYGDLQTLHTATGGAKSDPETNVAGVDIEVASHWLASMVAKLPTSSK